MQRGMGVVGVVVLGIGSLWAAAPPVRGSRAFTEAELERLERLDARTLEHERAGRFAEAEKLARQSLALHERVLGRGHWQTSTVREYVENSGRLAKLPRKAQAAAARAAELRERAGNEYSQARYAAALALYQQALQVCREGIGERHPYTAGSYNFVARCLAAQGKHVEALPLYRTALAICRETLGERHAHTAAAYNNVSGCLRALGRVSEALPLLKKALAINRQVRGEADPDTATSYDSLALALRAQGKYAEALPLFRTALAIRERALGARHPHTATGYNNVAGCLGDLGRVAEAQLLHEKALAARKETLGEAHPDTALSYSNLASCLVAQGKYAEALPLHRKAVQRFRESLGPRHPTTARAYLGLSITLSFQGKHAEALPAARTALAIFRTAFGERHPQTAGAYGYVAECLSGQGRLDEAVPLLQKALQVHRETAGDDHPDTAGRYSTLATCLQRQGRCAEALPLHEKALAIWKKSLGEEHADTAAGYNNVAGCLDDQGRHAEALPLHEKALAILRKMVGERHPDTANSYNNVAVCLQQLDRPAEALPLHEKALAIRRATLGEQHNTTIASYNNAALCLEALDRAADALPLLRKTLEVRRATLGERHPSTALSYNNLARNLEQQGKHAEALPLLQKALGIWRSSLGELHPHTALTTNNLANSLWRQGRRAEAARLWQASLPGQEAARFHLAGSGFDRAQALAANSSPHAALAVALAHLGQPGNAFRHAERSLARGLLDDLASAAGAGGRAALLRARLDRLSQAVASLAAGQRLTAEQARLVREHRETADALARLASDHSTRQVLPLERIQRSLPADAAFVLWIDAETIGEHWACVVRRQGLPRWARLRGSGQAGAWTAEDTALGGRLYRALTDPTSPPARRRQLSAAFVRQRLDPLKAHLEGVKRLFVVPSGVLARAPVEVLTTEYAVSYVPSGSVLARLAESHRRLDGSSLLAVGDPIFERTPPPPPASGALLRVVVPGGNADRAGLRAGDVLLAVGTSAIDSAADLPRALESAPAAILFWRDGEQRKGRLPGTPLGAVVDERSARAAVRAWRRENDQAHRGSGHRRLPGTRVEVEAIAALVKGSSVLLGPAASEQRLDELREQGRLKTFRILHLATHGEADALAPGRSALILAQDRLPSALEQARQGKHVYDGRLTVARIRAEWELDCDLVVLSACETGLGKEAGGDGLLGFVQAFLAKGARSVVLSRWKVDDTATALLMVRFYENLLGKRKELKQAMARAEALAEAKQWLAGLKRREAEALAVRLAGGVLRGTEGDVKPVVKGKPARLPEGERPFAHPYYWAAFVLVGDPE